MDTGQKNYYVPVLSTLDAIYVLHDELPEMNNEPGVSRNTIITTAGPLIPESATIAEGDNEVQYTFMSTPGFQVNTAQMGILEPQTIIFSHSDPMEILDGPSSFEKNEQQISVPSFCQNEPAFQVSSFHQVLQSSSHQQIPSSDQVWLISPFDAFSCFERNNEHSNEVSGVHQSQQFSLVGTISTVHELPPVCDQISRGFPPHGSGHHQYSTSNTTLCRQSCEKKSQPNHHVVSKPCPEIDSTNGQRFYKSDDLERHSRSTKIDGKSFECIECGTIFNKEFHLKCHYSKIHISTDEKPFKCDKCDAKFTTGKHLKAHDYRIHTGKKLCFFIRCNENGQFHNTFDSGKCCIS